MMNIVVCTDHNYVMPCGVMLYSLCKNNLNNEICFCVVIDESVTDSDKDDLKDIAGKFPNLQLIFYNIDGHLFDNFPSLGSGLYLTKATYYRLYLSEMLPQSMNKVLYLDCDMIVRTDISELWNVDVEDVAVAAAMDGMDGMIQLYNRLGYPIEKGYFNAGMLLINLKYWRKHDILNRCLNFIRDSRELIVSHDQDVLNVVLQNSKKNVDITYNFGECFLYRPQNMSFNFLKHKKEIDAFINNPAIVHYTVSKPWNQSCLNPFRTLFYKYRDETKWKGMPLQKKKYTKKEIVKELLYRLGIMHRVAVENPFRQINFELN